MYKYETHLHTKACSACAVSSALEMVDAAAGKGYSGIILTNHFYHGNTAIDRGLAWKDFVAAYAQDYETAAEYGAKQGVSVFFGIEEVYEPGKEMLIYGVTPETLAAYPEFNTMTLRQRTDFIHANGGIVFGAHPFRDRCYIPDPNREPDPTLFDGFEGYNACNAPAENEKAMRFAARCGKRVLSGSDVHSAADFGRAGIALEQKADTIADWIDAVLCGRYKLIINGEISDGAGACS